jgi:hypothetical protein
MDERILPRPFSDRLVYITGIVVPPREDSPRRGIAGQLEIANIEGIFTRSFPKWLMDVPSRAASQTARFSGFSRWFANSSCAQTSRPSSQLIAGAIIIQPQR